MIRQQTPWMASAMTPPSREYLRTLYERASLAQHHPDVPSGAKRHEACESPVTGLGYGAGAFQQPMENYTMNTATATAQRATSIIAGDRILVNLPANGKGRKHTVSEMFDAQGFRLNGLGQRLDTTAALDLSGIGKATQENGKPVFPMARYKAALDKAQTPNDDAVAAINAEYNLAVANWKAGRPQGDADTTIGTSIAGAVLSWVSATFGIKLSAQNSADYETIDPKSVAANVPLRNGTEPVVFTVTLAPVWG